MSVKPTFDEYRIYIGFSPEELIAVRVAEASIRQSAITDVPLRINYVSEEILRDHYTRRTVRTQDYTRYDTISQAPMSTAHAIARFFVPWLCDYSGWALFVDGDILCRRSIGALFALADERYAVMCVKHPPLLKEGMKKFNDTQQAYPRKNWSSVMLFNCGHPANAALTLDVCNSAPGRDLHRFMWLHDDQIGSLPEEWNVLANITKLEVMKPAIVHYTEGVPLVRGHEHDLFADEWWQMSQVAGFRLPAPQLAID